MLFPSFWAWKMRLEELGKIFPLMHPPWTEIENILGMGRVKWFRVGPYQMPKSKKGNKINKAGSQTGRITRHRTENAYSSITVPNTLDKMLVKVL